MAIGLLILIVMLGYCCWFFGRLHEAQVDARAEEEQQAAYRYAAAHNLLPDPIFKVRYVDLETGLVLDEQNG